MSAVSSVRSGPASSPTASPPAAVFFEQLDSPVVGLCEQFLERSLKVVLAEPSAMSAAARKPARGPQKAALRVRRATTRRRRVQRRLGQICKGHVWLRRPGNALLAGPKTGRSGPGASEAVERLEPASGEPSFACNSREGATHPRGAASRSAAGCHLERRVASYAGLARAIARGRGAGCQRHRNGYRAAGASWPFGDLTILVILAVYGLAAALCLGAVRLRPPSGAERFGEESLKERLPRSQAPSFPSSESTTSTLSRALAPIDAGRRHLHRQQSIPLHVRRKLGVTPAPFRQPQRGSTCRRNLCNVADRATAPSLPRLLPSPPTCCAPASVSVITCVSTAPTGKSSTTSCSASRRPPPMPFATAAATAISRSRCASQAAICLPRSKTTAAGSIFELRPRSTTRPRK